MSNIVNETNTIIGIIYTTILCMLFIVYITMT